jgi:hypothetical protein
LVRKITPWLVASGLFAVAALALQLGAPGTRVYVDVPGPLATDSVAAPAETLPLPHSLRA